MCNFPYILNNNSNICLTYAQAIGSIYTWYHVLFICISLVALGSVLYLCYNYYQNFSEIKDIVYSTKMVSILIGASSCLLIESIDPQGFNAIIPYAFETLVSNFCTYFCFLGIYIVIITLMQKIDPQFYNFTYMSLWWTLFISSFIFTIIVSFLQSYNDKYLWRGIKFTVFAIFIFVLSIFLNYYLISMFVQYNKFLKTGRNATQFIIIQKKIRTQLTRYNIFIIIVLVFQIWSAVRSFNHVGNILIPQLSIDDVFYPIAQVIGIILGVLFIIKRPEPHVISHYRLFQKKDNVSHIETLLENADESINTNNNTEINEIIDLEEEPPILLSTFIGDNIV